MRLWVPLLSLLALLPITLADPVPPGVCPFEARKQDIQEWYRNPDPAARYPRLLSQVGFWIGSMLKIARDFSEDWDSCMPFMLGPEAFASFVAGTMPEDQDDLIDKACDCWDQLKQRVDIWVREGRNLADMRVKYVAGSNGLQAQDGTCQGL